MSSIADKISAGLFGLALGDSYGSLLEEKKNMGQYSGLVSDDTSLTLAVGKGILENPSNPAPFIGNHFIRWFHENPVGIGTITKMAFEGYDLKLDWGYAVEYAHNNLDGRSAGNGSLMRTLPIPLMYTNFKEMLLVAGEQSYLTHYDPKCKEACQLYSWLVYLLLRGDSKEDALAEVFREHLHYGQYIKETYETLKTTAYVADTLLAVLTVFYKTQSFEEALEISINLGGDRDTIGALTCGLAGIYYGMEGLPLRRVKQLVVYEDLKDLGQAIVTKRNEIKEA